MSDGFRPESRRKIWNMRKASIKLNRADVTSAVSGAGFVLVININENSAKNRPTGMQELIVGEAC